MAETDYQRFKKEFPKKIRPEDYSLFLVYGEELLYKEILDKIVSAILTEKEKRHAFEPVDGSVQGNVDSVIERMKTYSLMAQNRVVGLLDSRIFYSKTDKDDLLEKGKAAWDQNDMKKAVRFVANVLSLLNLSFEEIAAMADRSAVIEKFARDEEDAKWLEKAIDYGIGTGTKTPGATDEGKRLGEALEKGFPKANRLIISADVVDKRKALYKIIKEKGLVVDCSVPKGDRRSDRMAQKAVLNDMIGEILKKNGVTLDPEAYSVLLEMTGFDLRTLKTNVEKLINYVGKEKTITVSDVETALRRTKQDPIYELTNAVADRDLENALVLLNSLLDSGYFPLQVLAAMINQFRRLLTAKDFTTGDHGKNWRPAIRYDEFQKQVLPDIIRYDEETAKMIDEWNERLFAEKSGKKKKETTDLKLAKNPKSPYPVYLLLQKSEKFRTDDVIFALQILSGADIKLKTSATDARLVLEKAVFDALRGAP